MAIAGLVLVLLLFILNLTVTDGTINAFILYVNIISINTPVFFPKYTLAYTFISLANLDLGIQTCFYNGMDDYAKMWLQLAFPFYLIFIATSLIITSRYSTTIHKLTVRRALPVLATLFLLSYTKIILITSRVLFFYSTIIQLPSKRTSLVWSVDGNVKLFELKFTILFIACLILILILLPFNAILLFTRTLARFHIISRIRPFLDAYQGPYKIKFYYWTGVQLVIRVVFYGISSLDRNINLTIGIMLLGILSGIHGILRPFKSNGKNFQEMMFILNLLCLFAMTLYSQDTTIPTNVLIGIAAIQLSLIVMYHIITYVCGEETRIKVEMIAAKLAERLSIGFNGQLNLEFDDQNVNYYREFQEPLVGFD